MKEEIERLIENDDWTGARSLILSACTDNPTDHWLITRLSLTYYEERDYRKALEYSRRAVELKSDCPLVLWDLAGALQMLAQHTEAIDTYDRIIRQGLRRLVHGACGEGKAWARGLIADSFYRVSVSFKALGARSMSLEAFAQHLEIRGPGCRSIYPLRTLDELRAGQIPRNKRPGLTRRCSRPVTPAIAATMRRTKQRRVKSRRAGAPGG